MLLFSSFSESSVTPSDVEAWGTCTLLEYFHFLLVYFYSATATCNYMHTLLWLALRIFEDIQNQTFTQVLFVWMTVSYTKVTFIHSVFTLTQVWLLGTSHSTECKMHIHTCHLNMVATSSAEVKRIRRIIYITHMGMLEIRSGIGNWWDFAFPRNIVCVLQWAVLQSVASINTHKAHRHRHRHTNPAALSEQHINSSAKTVHKSSVSTAR